MRGFVLILIGVLILAFNAYAAVNQWDDSEETVKYDSPGAFTLDDDPTYIAWDLATNIWSVRDPLVNNTIGTEANPGDPANPRRLGGLRIRNQVDTIVTITNSFDGFVEVLFLDDGTYTNGSTIRFISDDVSTVTGSQADQNNVRNRDNARWGFRANGAEYQDTVIMEEGHYVGKNANAGGVVDDLNALYIYGTKFEGGGPQNFLNSNGKDRNGQGGHGLALGMSNTNGIHMTVISNRLVEADAIRGGDGSLRVRQNANNDNAFAYGGDGLRVDSPNNGSDIIDIQSLPAYGGNGGLVDFAHGNNNPVDVNGGTAVNINDMTISIANGAFYGGNAGQVNSSSNAVSLDAHGGHGIRITGNSTLTAVDNVFASGGDGGVVGIAVDADGVDATGGHGALVDATLAFSSMNNLTALGGNGGDVTASGALNPVDVSGGDGFKFEGTGTDLVLSNVFIKGGNGGGGNGEVSVTADGGDGIRIDNYDLTVTNGSFIGGNGGVANGNGSSSADGGFGLFVSRATLNLQNVDFFGGQGGTANGNAQEDGFGLSMYDSNMSISNGTFTGRGFISESRFRSRIGGAINIQDSTFSRAEFTGTGTHTIDISDSAFATIELGGPSPLGLNNLTADNSTFDLVSYTGRLKNNSTFSASTIGNISKTDAGIISVRMDTNTTVNGSIYQNGGTLNFNEWNSSQINSVMIDAGTMNFSAGNLTLNSGDMFMLGNTGSKANFKNDVTVESGGMLDVGLGTFTGPNFLAETGAELGTAFNETTAGIIKGDNLVFEEDLIWRFYGSSLKISNTFLLASATANLNSAVKLTDFVTDVADWMVGIQRVYTNNNNLYLDYGAIKLADTIPSTGGFNKALQDLDTLMSAGMLSTLNNSFSSAQDAAPALFNTYVRTPEAANTMIDLQHSLAWQQYERFTTFRRYNNWANRPSSLRPVGSRGPDGMFDSAQDWFDEHLPIKDWWNSTVDWTEDRLPGKDALESTKDWAETYLPKADVRDMVDDLPEPDLIGPVKNALDFLPGEETLDSIKMAADELPGKEVLESVQLALDNVLPDADVVESIKSTTETYDPLPKLAESARVTIDNILPEGDVMESISSATEAYDPLPKLAESAKVSMENILPEGDVMESINSTVETYDPLPKLAESAQVSMENVLPEGDVLAAVNSAVEDIDPLPELADAAGTAVPEDRGFLAKIKGWLSRGEREVHTEDIELPKTYQAWGRAYGQTLKQDPDTGFNGYRAFIGGGTIGFDKSFDNLLAGIGGGFAQTTINGYKENDGSATTGHGSLYATASGERTYLDVSATYALNDIETETHQAFGYKADFMASTLNFYAGGGIGFPMFNDQVLLTPEASFQATYYDQEAYTEKSSIFPDKKWDAYDQWSYLSALGLNISAIQKIDWFNLDLEFRPELRIHWLHEFNNEMDRPTYTMSGGANEIAVSLQAREEDLVKIGAGIKFAQWDSDALEFSLDVDATVGQDYQAVIGSGRIMHRF